jgi:hypothetical protein
VNERACRRCGRATWSSRSPYCLQHRPPPEVRARWATKTRETRGYGSRHKAERRRWEPLVQAGVVDCVRCGLLIPPGTRWHLDHEDDGLHYRGPAHAMCNMRAAAKRGNQLMRAKYAPRVASREW